MRLSYSSSDVAFRKVVIYFDSLRCSIDGVLVQTQVNLALSSVCQKISSELDFFRLGQLESFAITFYGLLELTNFDQLIAIEFEIIGVSRISVQLNWLKHNVFGVVISQTQNVFTRNTHVWVFDAEF